MSWIEPIFDRTLQDISNVKSQLAYIQQTGWSTLSATEKNNFLGELRGTFGKTTLERIINNIYYLEEVLLAHGYNPVLPMRLGKSWSFSSIVTFNQLKGLVADVQALVDCSYNTIRNLPKDVTYLDYQMVNDIEHVMWNINWFIGKIEEHILYCGQAKCGQTVVGGLLYAR